MASQELLDFIKSQISKGISTDVIKQKLINNGWEDKDISNGFNVIENPNISNIDTDNTNLIKIVLLITVFLLLVAGGVSAYYFRNDIPFLKDQIDTKVVPIEQIKQIDNSSVLPQNSNISSTSEVEVENLVATGTIQDVSPVIKTEENKNIPLVIQNTDKNKSSSNITKTGPIDCGKDVKCFLNASKNCTPAFVEEDREIDIFGLTQTDKLKNTIEGLNSSKRCIYLSHVNDVKVTASPEIMAQAKSGGITDDEIKSTLEKANVSARATIGVDTKCTFETSYLNKLLINWQNKTFSSDDMSSGDCKITGGNLPPSSKTVYLTVNNEVSIDDFTFKGINITKNSAKILIRNVLDGKEQTVDFILNKDVIVFGRTMQLEEVEENKSYYNGEVSISLNAGIMLVDK